MDTQMLLQFLQSLGLGGLGGLQLPAAPPAAAPVAPAPAATPSYGNQPMRPDGGMFAAARHQGTDASGPKQQYRQQIKSWREQRPERPAGMPAFPGAFQQSPAMQSWQAAKPQRPAGLPVPVRQSPLDGANFHIRPTVQG